MKIKLLFEKTNKVYILKGYKIIFMKIYIVVFLFELLFVFKANSQCGDVKSIDKESMEYINKLKIELNLKIKETDTLFIYNHRCLGCLPSKDTCRSLNNTYIVFTKKGQPYFTIIDDCYNYYPVKTNQKFISNLYSIQDSIKKEKLITPRIYSNHIWVNKMIFIDGKNDFQITLAEDYFYSTFNTELDSALVYNNHTLIKKFIDEANNYFINLSKSNIPATKKGRFSTNPNVITVTPAEFE